MIPMIAAAGAGMDMARLGLAKASLQQAVDAAVVAGAGAYQSDTSSGRASSTATTYFNNYAAAMGGAIASPVITVTTSTGNNSQGLSSYIVSATATASLSASLMSVVGVRSLAVQASASAANPIAQPVIGMGSVGSLAGDWNSVYMYAVPTSGPGYNYAALPQLSQMYEVGSNCNSQSAAYTTSSMCNGMVGATAPATQSFSISSTTRLGFMLVNMTSGLSGSQINNQYGSTPGAAEILYTGPLSQGLAPTASTNSSASLIRTMTGLTLGQPSTTYPANNNCSLIIQIVDPKNLPTRAPYTGMCFSPTDPRSGAQYANMTCGEMAGRTFMYWWNDMGGPGDDLDYNDYYYTVSCRPGNASPNAGNMVNSTAANQNLNVSMVR